MLISAIRDEGALKVATRIEAATKTSQHTVAEPEGVRNAANLLLTYFLEQEEAVAMTDSTEAFSAASTSLEEMLWVAFFNKMPPSKSHVMFSSNRQSMSSQQQQSWDVMPGSEDYFETLKFQNRLSNIITILVPWVISISMGMLLPCLNIWFGSPGHYPGQRQGRPRLQNGLPPNSWFGTMRKNRWRQRVDKALQLYHKQLTEEDHVVLVDVAAALKDPQQKHDPKITTGNNCYTCASGGDCLVEGWMIPVAGTALRQDALLPPSNDSEDRHMRAMHPQSKRPITEQCAICLMSYNCGDELAWSSNPNCVHSFHYDCILTWLLKRRNKNTLPCPCCRQSFVIENEKN